MDPAVLLELDPRMFDLMFVTLMIKQAQDAR